MKNTNKFLSAVIAATIALCASVQVSAMNNQEIQNLERMIANLEDHYRPIADPKNWSPSVYRSQGHQERIQDNENTIAQLKAELAELKRNNR